MSRSRPQQPSRATRRGRSGRGAALVEYILLLSVFVVAVVYSLDLINEEVEEDASETAYDIGGIPGSTVPGSGDAGDAGGDVGDGADGADAGDGGGGVDAGDDAGADDGLADDNEVPVVYAGPDRVVSPSRTVWTTQAGTVFDSDTPGGLLDVSWASSSSQLVTTNRTHVNGDTSIDFRAERPGTYSLTLSASDGYLTGSDTAQVKVTSGIVTATSMSLFGWWTDHNLLSWNAKARFRVVNPFGWPIAGLTVTGRWTFTTAPTETATCTTSADGWCEIFRVSISPSVTQVCFELVNVTGPTGCYDGWDGAPRSTCLLKSSMTVPTTTTTTTRPPTTTTTTTRPPSTTTTTRPGGSTTSTTRPPSTTTTTRPPTTTTTTTISL